MAKKLTNYDTWLISSYNFVICLSRSHSYVQLGLHQSSSQYLNFVCMAISLSSLKFKTQGHVYML